MKTLAELQEIVEDEFKLRDHIAANIEDLESGLRILKKEYALQNARGGAGGRADILAADELDHVVVIEVKKSDGTAREALHELSKYVALLIERDRVPRELIRCIVVSTVWHELELPLAYFRATAQVDVQGMEPFIDNNVLRFRRRNLLPVYTLPQFSPEISIYHYQSLENYRTHISRISKRMAQIPFARLASCLFEQADVDGEGGLKAVMCLWRIRPEDYELLSAAIGNPIGHLFPYGYPGWEAECDCLFWLADETSEGCTVFFSAESQRGTPEKVLSISRSHELRTVDRLGDWPRLEVVNTFDRILSQLTAVSGLAGTPRRNRHSFIGTASPQYRPSWTKTIDDFVEFLKGVPEWQLFVKKACSDLEHQPDLKVTFSAFDKNHFFYALHQATEHPNVHLSRFHIHAKQGEHTVYVAEGSWEWNGSRAFGKAKDEISKVFGSTIWAVLAAYSAVDERRYEAAYISHGFRPYIRILVSDGNGSGRWEDRLRAPGASLSFEQFVDRNSDYIAEVSRELSTVGDLPTSSART